MSIKKLASHIEMEEGNACFALSVQWKNIFIFFFFEKTEQGYSQLDELLLVKTIAIQIYISNEIYHCRWSSSGKNRYHNFDFNYDFL